MIPDGIEPGAEGRQRMVKILLSLRKALQNQILDFAAFFY